jgi:hypothetical protein
MPLMAKASILAVVLAIAGYPLASSFWLPHVVCDILAFALPVVSCLAVSVAYFWYRQALSREQLAHLRIAVVCSAALLLAIVLLMATSLPFIGVNVGTAR